MENNTKISPSGLGILKRDLVAKHYGKNPVFSDSNIFYITFLFSFNLKGGANVFSHNQFLLMFIIVLIVYQFKL